MTNLNDTIAGLRARREQIQPELDTLRDDRGAAALKAAMSGDAKPLDELDGRIATLERELGDITVALAEAARQQSEQKDRDRISASKAAVKQLPNATKKLVAAHTALFKAVDGLLEAVGELNQVEGEINMVADSAVPFEVGIGDAGNRYAFRFNHSSSVTKIVEQALNAKSSELLAARIAEDRDATMARILTNADIRQQKLEQKLAAQRAQRPLAA